VHGSDGQNGEVLRVERLHAGYGKLHVLFGIDMVVSRGEIVVVLGPNGAGKSTLLDSIMGLADIYSGRVIVMGRDVTGKPPHEIVKLGVAYVMQSPDNIFSGLTVLENLLAASTGLSRREARRRIELVLDAFPRLRELSNVRARFLSGGERQLLAIAMGLMKGPRLLMLDEPSAGLSPKVVDEVFATIKQVRDRLGVSVLLVEQNARKALEIGDRAYVLSTGEIKYSGSTRDLDEDKLASIIFGKAVAQF
jgi:branched-chain amino acid transport system ATP-binding protein